MNRIGMISGFFKANRLPRELTFRKLSVKQIIYEENGDPAKVLKMTTRELDVNLMRDDEVLLQWRASPINPADINQIQGVYPVKPPLPAVGGNEGCAVVQAVGANVTRLAVNDLVIPARSGLGTWTNYGIYPAKELYRIAVAGQDRPPIDAASTIQVNPSTAYRMLYDFVQLKAGDLVVQNGGNSAVGRYVIQICRILRLKSINVVRDRPSIFELKCELQELGADEVFSEEEFAKAVRDIRTAKLALNCVGGRSSMNLTRALAPYGCMVTYGGMSKQPVQVPTGSLIFSDISLRGFWMSRWYECAENSEERKKMYTQLFEWIHAGQLKTPPMRERAFDEEFVEAFSDYSDGAKQLFVF